MPPRRSPRPFSRAPGSAHASAVAAVVVGMFCTAPTAMATDPGSPQAVRSRRVELHYRIAGAAGPAEIELWYTRDRGFTWHRWGVDDDRESPIIFVAPAEGLYGFKLIAHDGRRASSLPPGAHDPPHRWVFIDYTPPLAQWDSAELADTGSEERVVRLAWTAFDNNLPPRCVSLSYQSSIDQAWHTIDGLLPNTGRYDWALPDDLAGQVTLKLAVRDEGGHVVERLFGPTPAEPWRTAPRTPAPPDTQPALAAGSGDVAGEAATQPAHGDAPLADSTSPASLTSTQRQKARHLYEQGSANLLAGRYAVAAERFREALEIEPDMLEAINDLAGVYYLQRDYGRALEHYQAALQRDAEHLPALRGAALAYVAQREYPRTRVMLERLLAIDGKDAESWLDLGDVLFMMGDHAGARERWAQAATVNAEARAVIEKARRRLDLGPAGAASGTPSPESASARADR